MKKRIFSALLVMSLAVFPTLTAQAEEVPDDYLTFMPIEESIYVDAEGQDQAAVQPGQYYSTIDGEHFEEEQGIPLPSPIPGDMDEDGTYCLKDVATTFNLAVNGGTKKQKALADFNEDGTLSLQDAEDLFEQVSQRSNGIRIYISPSNQNANSYAAGNTNEAVQCNRVAFAVQRALMRCGFSTMLADYCDNMDIRADYSNSWGADLHLPLHTNGHYEVGTYYSGGTQVYYDPSDATATAWAKTVYSALAPVTPGNSIYEGLRINQSWKEVMLTNAPTVYCEMEYHDVVSYANWIIAHTNDLAEAITKGICDCFDVTYFK